MKKWIMLAIVCSLVFMANYTQFQISALAAVVMPQLGISPVEFSSVLFAPMLAAVVLGIPFGMLADRFGSKWLIACCTIVSAVACVARVSCTGFVQLFAVSVAMGFAPAALNSNLIKVLGAWFGSRTDFAAGWYYAMGSAGMACSLATSALFPNAKSAYIAAGVAFALAGIAWIAVFEEGPGTVQRSVDENMFSCLGSAAKCVSVWLVALLLGLGLASTEAFSGFLTTALEGSVGLAAAGALASLVTFGSILGAVVAPWIRARFRNYKTFLIVVTSAGTVMLCATALTLENPVPLVMFLTGVLTAACGPILQGLPYQLPEIGSRFAGSAGGIVSTVSLAMTYFVPMAIAAGGGEDFGMMVMLSVACFGLGIPVMFFLPGPAKLGAADARIA